MICDLCSLLSINFVFNFAYGLLYCMLVGKGRESISQCFGSGTGVSGTFWVEAEVEAIFENHLEAEALVKKKLEAEAEAEAEAILKKFGWKRKRKRFFSLSGSGSGSF